MKLHAGRSLIWVSVESGGLSILSLSVLFFVARVLGPSDLGTVSLAIGIIQMLAMLVDTLLHDAIVQQPDLQDDHLHTAFWTCLGIGCGCSTAIWFLAPALGRLFESPTLPVLLAIAGLSLVLSGAGSVPIAILRRRFAFKELALRTLYGRLAGAIAAIALVLCGYGVWALIAQFLLQAAVNTALVWRFTTWRPEWIFSGRRLTELLSFGIHSVGARLAALSTARLFTVLVGYFLGVTAVGYLSIAQRLIDTLYDVLSGAAYNLALPIFSRKQHDRNSLVVSYSRATSLSALIVLPIFAGLAICAPAIVAVFLGEAWSMVVPLVQVIAIGAVLQFSLLFGEAATNALGHPLYTLSYAAISLAFVLCAFFFFPPMNSFDAAIIWGARSVLAAPFMLVCVHYLLGSTATINFLKSMLAPLIGVAAMVATISAVNINLLSGSFPLYRLFVQIPLGMIVYGAVIALINREALKQFIALFVSGLKRITPDDASPAPIRQFVPKYNTAMSGATLMEIPINPARRATLTE